VWPLDRAGYVKVSFCMSNEIEKRHGAVGGIV